MIFQKTFEFASPSEEEIKTVKQISKSNPEDLDGRELWILQAFTESEPDEPY